MFFFMIRLANIGHDVVLERIEFTARRDLWIELANRTRRDIPRIGKRLRAFLLEFTVNSLELFVRKKNFTTDDKMADSG